MLRFRTVAALYAARLRTTWLQELLAAAGIATGVALVLAVLAANTSITSNARDLVGAVAGDAQLQVSSRDTAGFQPARVVDRIRAVDGVEHVVPLLEQRAVLRAGARTVAVTLVGLDPALAELGGVASRPALLGVGLLPGVVVTSAAGAPLDLPARGGAVSVDVRGRATATPVSGVFGSSEVGVLASAPFAAAPLRRVQTLTGLPGRVTRLLIAVRPGTEAKVLGALDSAIGGRLSVEPVSSELDALAIATAPNDQATTLFAAVGVLIGLLLAATAMLLTVPARRREIAQLRIYGFTNRQVVIVVFAHALMLGLPASLAGIAGGVLLANAASLQPPGYLALAFPIGSEIRLAWWMFAAAILGGTGAACLAAAQPLFDLRRGKSIVAIYNASGNPGQSITPRTVRRITAIAAAMVVATVAMTQMWPSTSVAGVGLLVIAALLALPATLRAVLAVADGLDRRLDRPSALPGAVGSVRAAQIRAVALAATCTAALAGALAIDGARQDLIDGLNRTYSQYVATAPIWIAQRGDNLALQPFAVSTETVRQVDGVADVREYRGSLLDVGDRRAWVIARPRNDDALLPATDVVDGKYEIATANIRSGGWIAVSKQLADAERVAVGDTLQLPTPTGPRPFRIAATTGNLGWGPGAIVMNADDYRRAWDSPLPSALEVDVEPGTSPAEVRDRIQTALGSTSPLVVQTSAERLDETVDIARAGLARLRQIAVSLVLAAAVAIAAAMIAAIRDQRAQLAAAKTLGLDRTTLWRAMMLESGLVLLAGSVAGIAAGAFGHYLGGRWLQLTTGYPAPWSWAPGQALLTTAIIVGVALAVTAVPGYLTTNPPARLALNRR